MRKDDLLDLALELFDGESKAGLLCPACKGGSGGEHSFWMSRDQRYVIYKCYRAKCGIGGKLNIRNQTAQERKEELGGKRRVLETSPLPLDESTREYLKERYFLTDDELFLGEVGITTMHCHQTTFRVYLPMLRYNSTIRGYTARDISGEENRKALTFKWDEAEPNMGWYTNRQSKKLVIVEDQFSAMRARTYVNAVALMGVDLNKDKVDEIRRQGFVDAYLCLDADATRKAIKQSLEWRSYLKLNVIALDEDLKDMSREELTKFMEKL